MSVASQDSAYDGETVAKQAKEWIDRVNASAGPSGGWRLQVIRFRTRRKFGKPDSFLDPVPEPDPSVTDVNGDPVASLSDDSSGDPCDELPVRIRRFVPGCPWALVDQAVRYLHRIAPYRGIVYNGVRLEGAYRPTLTMWQRDEQSLSPAERGSLGTYTLIQDLVEITECPDELLAPTASSCQAYEETKFVWDADSVEELPVTCEQGVTYSIRAVRRNDDGTYDYQLVKTVSKTSSWGPVTIECTSQQETVEWGWKNLYGEPGSGLYAVPCGSDERTLVDLPPECDERGVLTQVQLTQNQDCTFDAVVRRRTSKPYEDEWTEGTSCRPETTTAYENQRSPLPVPAAQPGEVVRVQMRRNPDDTYSGSVSVRGAPEPLEYSWVDGPSCRQRETTVLRDQVERPAVPAVSPGQTMEASLERGEDCLWNARFSVTDPAPSEDIAWTEGSQCREVESHRLLSQTDYHGVVPAPGPGESVSASVERNADCTYDVSYKVQKPFGGAAPEWTDGPVCRPRRHTLWIDQKEQPQIASAAPGETVDASLRFDPSSCTWSGEQVVVSPADADRMEWTEGSRCREVESAVLVNQADYAGLVPEPGEGESVSASVSRNADCTYDVSYKVRKPASGVAVEWADGSECRHVAHRAWFDVKDQPSFTEPAPGRTVDASLRFNPDDCTWSGQESVAESEEDLLEWTDGTACGATRAVTQYMNRGAPVEAPEPREGETVRVAQSRNADCTYNTEVVVETAREMDTGLVEWTSRETGANRVSWYSHGYRAFRNVVGDPPRPEGDHNWTYELRQNDDCTWSGHMAYKDLDRWESSAAEGGIRENDYRYSDVPVYFTGASGIRTVVGYDRYHVPSITFIGSGNEGTEAYWQTHGAEWLPPGVHLGRRTYAKYVEVKYHDSDEWKLLSGDPNNVQSMPEGSSRTS